MDRPAGGGGWRHGAEEKSAGADQVDGESMAPPGFAPSKRSACSGQALAGRPRRLSPHQHAAGRLWETQEHHVISLALCRIDWTIIRDMRLRHLSGLVLLH